MKFRLLVVLAPTVLNMFFSGATLQNYDTNDKVELTVNALSSLHKSLIPWDYYDARLHLCKIGTPTSIQESLGGVLYGDRLFSSPYQLFMKTNTTCNLLCNTKVPAVDAEFINKAIEDQYLLKWMVDGLPASQQSKLDGRSIHGFLLGQMKAGVPTLNNHYNIYVYFNSIAPTVHRVVRVEVDPQSLTKNTCVQTDNEPLVLKTDSETSISYTYSVSWVPLAIDWENRWSNYLVSNDGRVHWFSLVNSVIVVVLLSAIVFGIIVRALSLDFNRYNDIEMEEEFGWKLVHGDVFRSPPQRTFLSIFVGNGIQLAFMCSATLVLAHLGLMFPSNRGALVSAMVVLYLLCGGVAGYVSARIYKMTGGQAWRQNVILSSFLLPGCLFLTLLCVNFILISKGSSSAVPFSTLVSVLALWLLLSAPLSFLGAYRGFTAQVT